MNEALDALLIVLIVMASAVTTLAWLTFLFFLMRSYVQENGGFNVWIFSEPRSLFRLSDGPRGRRPVKLSLYVFVAAVLSCLALTALRSSLA